LGFNGASITEALGLKAARTDGLEEIKLNEWLSLPKTALPATSAKNFRPKHSSRSAKLEKAFVVRFRLERLRRSYTSKRD